MIAWCNVLATPTARTSVDRSEPAPTTSRHATSTTQARCLDREESRLDPQDTIRALVVLIIVLIGLNAAQAAAMLARANKSTAPTCVISAATTFAGTVTLGLLLLAALRE